MTLNNLRDGSSPPFWYAIQAIAKLIFFNPKRNGRLKKFYHQPHNELCDATDGVIMIDNQGKIVQLSASAAVLFSYRATELQGRPIQVLIPDADFSVNRPENSRPRSEGHVARKKNGMEFRLELMVSYNQCSQDRNAFIWVSAQ
jgi:PAS domain S-box-containing protein